MRVLVVHPGASYATAEVYHGLVDGLVALGVSVEPYALDARIAVAGAWLTSVWRRYGRRAGVVRPTPADILYWAANEVSLRVARSQPDWVLVVSGMYVHPDYIVLWRRMGIPVAVVFTESPYDDDRQAWVARYVECAWVNDRASVDRLRAVSGNAEIEYLPAAFSPAVHRPGPCPGDAEVPAHDVVFVGTGFEERCRFLAQVDWDGLGIDLGLYGEWSLLPRRLRRYVRGRAVDNRVAAALYRRAKVVLNLHRTSAGFGRGVPRVAGAESLNPRLYELAACRVCVVSDPRPELRERAGDAVGYFTTPDTLARLLPSLLADADRRERMAAALHARLGTAADTWLARAAVVARALAARRPIRGSTGVGVGVGIGIGEGVGASVGQTVDAVARS